jgi:mono/diheme cytochrome c family protein
MKTRSIVGVSVATLLLACQVARAASADDNWKQHCASCHGSDGAGHTKMGRKVEARDLTDPAYQKTFTDGVLLDHLKNGEKAPDGAVKMKPYGDRLTDEELRGLVTFVRALAKAG